jgi:hypothetical protein
MFRIIISFWLILLIFQPLLTRAQVRTCGTVAYTDAQLSNNPEYRELFDKVNRYTDTYLSENGSRETSGLVYTIPVVVHVIWNSAPESLVMSQIQSQIDAMNKDFRRLNSDTTNTPAMFLPVAADAEIEFCMAVQDPGGNPTSGVTYTQTSVTAFTHLNNNMKFTGSGGKDAWPTTDYLNLWVCDISADDNILGFAQLPGSGAASTDGVVIDYRYFGTSGTATFPFNKGRTGTHEVGHWLNLRHIWGDGGCTVDDGVSDTPVSDAPNFGCPTGHISCGTTDMVQNYMDYSDDACMNLFSSGQASRMRSVLNAGGYRNSLLSSNGCNSSSNCPTPGGLTVSNIQNTQATLNWTAVSAAVTYNIRARQFGTTTWTTGNTSGTSINFTSLVACTEYEFQVQTVCAGTTTSGWSSTQNFTTAGCTGSCSVPGGLAVSSTTDSSAVLTWNAVSGAIDYDVRARQVGTPGWATGTVSTTSADYTGLLFCSDYEFQVKANCSGGASSSWSPLYAFTTAGCTYCESYGQSTMDEWIKEVHIGSFSNVSGDNSGYGDFTNMTVTLQQGQTYPITLVPGFTGAAFFERWRIWIDFNQDYVFSQTGDEFAYNAPGASNGTLTGSITIPANAPLGNTRMRIAMKYNTASNPCEIFDFGEVEDYTVQIISSSTAIGDPDFEMLNGVQAFPNPFTGQINLQADWQKAFRGRIRLTDLAGKVLFEKREQAPAGSWEFMVDPGTLAPGIYLLQIVSENGERMIRKMVRQ